MKIKALIFDQDETLIQPDTGLYERYIIERAKDYASVFDIKNIEDAKRLAFKDKIEKCNDSTITLYELMGIPTTVWYDKINRIDVKPYLKKDQSLSMFLGQLKSKRLLTFLLTNSPTKQTHKILEAVGINKRTFDHIFSWERDKIPPKPSKKPFHYIFKEFNLSPSECIMVGNEIKVDLETAHNLGIITIGINLETKPNEKVSYVANNLEEIFELINTIESKG